ncbi:MAG: PQQ-dependent sugar dehydrogenase [Bacteroidota bacterium]
MKNCLLLLLCLCWLYTPVTAQLSMPTYANGFSRPVDIVNAGDDRLFIVEQGGLIKIIDGDGNTQAIPFLDLRSRVNFGASEQGLLGLAFHPDYATNGYFFVNYTGGNGNGETRVARFKVSDANPNFADASTEEVVLTVSQPEWNHNGGGLQFGPDGYLYIGLGDGGSGGDPWGNGQNTEVMLGKMLRIDVNGTSGYTIPGDNPFVNTADYLAEIWAFGLRNPWRFSFDRLTGDMWIGDVGQNAKEEIDFQPASSAGGENYGWDCREGDQNFGNSSSACAGLTNFAEPVASYKVSNFCNSVTGGFVYRGCEFPDMYGKYFYADYCNGRVWTIEPDGAGGWTNTEVFNNNAYDISTFGQDSKGELYAARLNSGAIVRLEMGDRRPTPEVVADGTTLSVQEDLGDYQWFFNNNMIDGATSASYTATESGFYKVDVTYTDACVTSSEEYELLIVNLEELSHLVDFSLSPNPFVDRLQLSVEFDQVLDVLVRVIDLKGQELYRQQLEGQSQFNEVMDLSTLAEGVYFLQLVTEEGELVRRVIKH